MTDSKKLRPRINSFSLFVSVLLTGLVCLSALPVQDEFLRYKEILPGTELTIQMVPITGGTYLAGSNPSEQGRESDEGPQHEVIIEDFWIGAYEITWDQYEVFLYREMDSEQHPSPGSVDLDVDGISSATMPYVNFNLPGHPVTNLTQYAASVFCEWLTAKTGRYYRLPTEAEWEYACRAGTASPFSFGDNDQNMDQYAWYIANSRGNFQPIGQKMPNPWGLYDMHGNVAEWVLDVYDEIGYENLPNGTEDPLITKDVLYPHVYRGGSWKDSPEKLRSANREYSGPELKKQDPQFPKSLWWLTDAGHIGFRIVRPRGIPDQMDKYRIKPIEEY